MSTTPAPSRIPVHRRSVLIEAFDLGKSLELVAQLRDERPWAEADERAVVHAMSLTLVVGKQTLEIVDAAVDMGTFPHAECPLIGPDYRKLVGLTIGRGYNRAVGERLAGPSGCAHLQQLALALGPAAMQALNSVVGYSRLREDGADARPWPPAGIRNTCHIWADDGPARQKVALGWRPRPDGPYPAPPVETLAAAHDPD